MPSSNEILFGLTHIANAYKIFAIGWHVIFFALIIVLFSGWRPSNRLLAVLLVLPFLSISIFAWLTHTYFNTFIFLLVSVILFAIALKINDHPVSVGPIWSSVGGSLLIVFGLIYPEFLHTDSLIEYVYASPAGLIPCPTLSVIIGFALIFFDNESRLWLIITFTLGLFYGIFGVLKLHVMLDTVLLAGSLVLFLKLIFSKKDKTRKKFASPGQQLISCKVD